MCLLKGDGLTLSTLGVGATRRGAEPLRLDKFTIDVNAAHSFLVMVDVWVHV